MGPVLFLAAAFSLASPSGAQDLPSPECVEQMRSARIAADTGDAKLEFERLGLAAEICGDAVEPIVALLAYSRRMKLGHEEQQKLRQRLISRLENPEYVMPPGVVTYLVRQKDLHEDVVRNILDHLSLRLQGLPAADTKVRAQLLRASADLHQRLGQNEDAVQAFEALRALDGDAPQDLDWRLLRLYRLLDNAEGQLAVLSRLRDVAPVLGQAYVAALLKTGDLESARAELRAAAPEEGASKEERLRYGALLGGIAWRFRDEHEDTVAEEYFREALRYAPQLQHAKMALAHLYGDETHREQIAAVEEKAMANNPFASLEKAAQLLTSSDYQGAYDILVVAAPALGSEPAWFNLGLAAYRIERFDTAALAYGKAAALNPERADSQFFLGLAHTKNEDCAAAIAPLEKALELDPSRRLAHYHLGICYDAVGNTAASQRHRKLYRDSKP